jgi:hypothetical protein
MLLLSKIPRSIWMFRRLLEKRVHDTRRGYRYDNGTALRKHE